MARLLTDLMLGKLTTYLRMAGHDVLYADDVDVERDEDVASEARSSDRTLLTRDRDLAETVDDAVPIESKDVEGQIREVWETGLDVRLTEPRRCSICNGPLERDDDAGPDDVSQAWRCRICGQGYWKGSHWDDVKERIEAAVGESDEGGQR